MVAIITFKINGIEFPPPVEWPGIRLLSEFTNGSVEAKTTIEALRFVNEAAVYIRNWRLAGLTGGPGIFEGPSFEMTVKDSTNTYTVKGFIDMSDGSYIERSPVDISAKIGRLDLLSDLDMKLSGVTLALLANLPHGAKGKISASDFSQVRYVVQQDFDFADFFSLLATAFMILREIIQLVKEIMKDLGNVLSLMSAVLTAPGALLYAVLSIILNIAYALVLFKVLIDLLEDIMNYIFPIAKKIKGLTLEKALIKIFEYAGYSFQSTFNLLPKLIYLPSKPQHEGNTGSKLLTGGHGFTLGGAGSTLPTRNNNLPSGKFKSPILTPKAPDFEGIPNAGDYGYRAIEMVDLAKQLCLGKLKVNNQKILGGNPNGTIELYPLNDPYWRQQTSYIARDVLDESKVFNAPELHSTRMVTFTTDVSDPWTIEDYMGTSYEINTTSFNPPLHKENVTLRGYEETRFPVALGVRKGENNAVEQAVGIVAEALDYAIEFFDRSIGSVTNAINTAAGSTNTTSPIPKSTLKQRVQSREGYLKIWNKYYHIPKLIYASETHPDGETKIIPADYRQHLSARALWENYLNYVSFVANNYGGQKRIFTDLRVPMTFAQWNIAKRNRFFRMADGRIAEFTSIKHLPDSDTALISGYIPEIYTKNLQETKIEAA